MMDLVRVRWRNSIRWGILEEDRIFALEGDIYHEFEKGTEFSQLSEVKLLPPAEPRIMVGCILNYRDRIKEEGRLAFRELSLFFKPLNTLIGHQDPILFPAGSQDNKFEAELCVVIKSPARNVSEEDAFNYVLGYTCGNDLTAFDFYKKDANLARSKAFDGAGPLGPVLATDLNPRHLSIRSRLNGKPVQNSNTDNMVFGIPKLINHISSFMTLNPGDVIWTGTPKGGGCPTKPGDVLEVEIEGIGTLKNEVVAPAP